MVLFTQIIGFLAAVFGTSLMLPQVIKMIKTKKVNDISLMMLVFYLLNCCLWLTYGFLIGSWPEIICNFLALFVSVAQLVLKFTYHEKK